MKKVLYTDFVTTESLVEELLGKKEVKKAITRNNLYKFWDKVAGAKICKQIKTIFNDGWRSYGNSLRKCNCGARINLEKNSTFSKI